MNNILITIGIVNLCLPIIGGILTGLIHYWSRGRAENPYGFINITNFKYKWMCKPPAGRSIKQHEEEVTYWGFVFGDLLAIPLVLTFFGVIVNKFGMFIPLVTLSIILSVFLLPKYFLDICHMLKYNFKSRDSERIAELERRLNERLNER